LKNGEATAGRDFSEENALIHHRKHRTLLTAGIDDLGHPRGGGYREPARILGRPMPEKSSVLEVLPRVSKVSSF